MQYPITFNYSLPLGTKESPFHSEDTYLQHYVDHVMGFYDFIELADVLMVQFLQTFYFSKHSWKISLEGGGEKGRREEGRGGRERGREGEEGERGEVGRERREVERGRTERREGGGSRGREKVEGGRGKERKRGEGGWQRKEGGTEKERGEKEREMGVRN